MRLLRYVAAVTLMLLSGWLLLGYYGLRTIAEDRAHGWEIYGLPSHPMMHMAASLTFGVALLFLAAWLMPQLQMDEVAKKTPPGSLLRSYAFRLAISFALALLAAVTLAILEMVLMDSGVI